MKKSIMLFCMVCFLCGTISAQLNQYVNNVIGNDANDGLSPILGGGPGMGPKKTISNAITTITSGGTIFIAATGISYVESPNVNKIVNFVGHSVSSTPEYVSISLTGGDMTFNIPGSATIYFLVLPIAGAGYSYNAAAGFKFKGTATTGFYFQLGQVVQANANFIINFPFCYRR